MWGYLIKISRIWMRLKFMLCCLSVEKAFIQRPFCNILHPKYLHSQQYEKHCNV